MTGKAGHGGPTRPSPAEPAAPPDPGPEPAPPPPGHLRRPHRAVSPARRASRPRLCASRWAPPRVATPPSSPAPNTALHNHAPTGRPRVAPPRVAPPLAACPGPGQPVFSGAPYRPRPRAARERKRPMPPAAWGECPSKRPHFSVAPTLPGGPAGSRAARLSERDSTAPVRSACFVGRK